MSREDAKVLRVKKSELITAMYKTIEAVDKVELLWKSKIDRVIDEGTRGGWCVTWDTSKDFIVVPIVDF